MLVRLTKVTTEAPLAPAFHVGRRIGIAGLASLIGGVLVLGVGGRLAMRLSGAMAILNDPSTRLRLTGDGFRIGVISIDGSLSLVIFGGVFGSIIAAGYWALFKSHLTRRRGLLYAGAAAAAIGGNQFVKAENIDFVILHPIAMNVVMYPMLSALAGVAIVVIDRRLEQSAWTLTVAGTTVLAAFGLIGASVLFALVLVAAEDEPWLAFELLVLAFVTAPLWLAEMRTRTVPNWVTRSSQVAVAGVIAIEWVRLLSTTREILG